MSETAAPPLTRTTRTTWSKHCANSAAKPAQIETDPPEFRRRQRPLYGERARDVLSIAKKLLAIHLPNPFDDRWFAAWRYWAGRPPAASARAGRRRDPDERSEVTTRFAPLSADAHRCWMMRWTRRGPSIRTFAPIPRQTATVRPGAG